MDLFAFPPSPTVAHLAPLCRGKDGSHRTQLLLQCTAWEDVWVAQLEPGLRWRIWDVISLGNLELVTSACTSQNSGECHQWPCSILVHHFTSPSATGPKMGTRIWAHRGRVVTVVITVLCWYCWEWQGALPTLLWVRGANSQTTRWFRPWWQQHTT